MFDGRLHHAIYPVAQSVPREGLVDEKQRHAVHPIIQNVPETPSQERVRRTVHPVVQSVPKENPVIGLSQRALVLAFKHWVTHIRTNLLDARERRICPMLWCRDSFGDDSATLDHFSTCRLLSNAWYWCPDHSRPERFMEGEDRGETVPRPMERRKNSQLKRAVTSFFNKHFCGKTAQSCDRSMSLWCPPVGISPALSRLSAYAIDPKVELEDTSQIKSSLIPYLGVDDMEAKGSSLQFLTQKDLPLLPESVVERSLYSMDQLEVFEADRTIDIVAELEAKIPFGGHSCSESRGPSFQEFFELVPNNVTQKGSFHHNIRAHAVYENCDTSSSVLQPNPVLETSSKVEKRSVGVFKGPCAWDLGLLEDESQHSPSSVEISPISDSVSSGAGLVSPISDTQLHPFIARNITLAASSDILGHFETRNIAEVFDLEAFGWDAGQESPPSPTHDHVIGHRYVAKTTTSPLSNNSYGEYIPTKTLIRDLRESVFLVNNEWIRRLSSTPDLLTRCSSLSAYMLFEIGIITLQRFFNGVPAFSFEEIFALVHVACASASILNDEDELYYSDEVFQGMLQWHTVILDEHDADLYSRVVGQLSCHQQHPVTSPDGYDHSDMGYCTLIPSQWSSTNTDDLASSWYDESEYGPSRQLVVAPSREDFIFRLQEGKIMRDCLIFLDGKLPMNLNVVVSRLTSYPRPRSCKCIGTK